MGALSNIINEPLLKTSHCSWAFCVCVLSYLDSSEFCGMGVTNQYKTPWLSTLSSKVGRGLGNLVLGFPKN